MEFSNNDITILGTYSGFGLTISNNGYINTLTVGTFSNLYYKIINVQISGGDFTSIVTALASITDNDINNRYIISVGVGLFIETLIDLAAKPYVSIVGASINNTIIEASGTSQHIVKLGEFNEISFLTLQGAGTGFSGIYTSDGGSFSQAHKISIYDCDICILAENTTVDSQLYLEYVDFGGVFAFGIKMVNTSTGILFVNAENQYGFPTSGLTTMYHVEGANAYFELNVSGNEPATVQGNGIVVHTGGHANIFSTYFDKFTTAISMPNTGATPTLFLMATKTQDCTTDINIAHTTGQGSFSGSMNAPVITITTTATFGIVYLENLLGNKHEIYFDAASFNLVTGITPTAIAATRATLTATGYSVLVFPGTGVTIVNASVNFRIPSDYLRNGRFKVIYTSATSANNIHWQFIVSNKAIGGNLAATTDTGLSTTSVAQTQYNVAQTSFITPPTAFVIGNTISIRVYRDPGHASDTAGVDAYVQGLVFEYESHK